MLYTQVEQPVSIRFMVDDDYVGSLFDVAFPICTNNLLFFHEVVETV